MVDCLRHRPASMIAQQVATFQVNPVEDKWNLDLMYFPFRVWYFISYKLLKTFPESESSSDSDAHHCHHYKVTRLYTQHSIKTKIGDPEMMFSSTFLPYGSLLKVWHAFTDVLSRQYHSIHVLQHKIMQ
jgi:hypothetical protein